MEALLATCVSYVYFHNNPEIQWIFFVLSPYRIFENSFIEANTWAFCLHIFPYLC